MCGRYYVDDGMLLELRKIVQNIDLTWKPEGKKDIYPSGEALVLKEENGSVAARKMVWGYPAFAASAKSRLLINARSESALEKKTFRDSICRGRCIIPAKGFYEWNKRKEKYHFERADQQPILLMAGCCREYDGVERFVILTTQANASVADVHDRMPLILEREEARTWLSDWEEACRLLNKRPGLLGRGTDYEQMSLF